MLTMSREVEETEEDMEVTVVVAPPTPLVDEDSTNRSPPPEVLILKIVVSARFVGSQVILPSDVGTGLITAINMKIYRVHWLQ